MTTNDTREDELRNNIEHILDRDIPDTDEEETELVNDIMKLITAHTERAVKEEMPNPRHAKPVYKSVERGGKFYTDEQIKRAELVARIDTLEKIGEYKGNYGEGFMSYVITDEIKALTAQLAALKGVTYD